MEVNTIDVLKLSATALTGLFTGGAIYINVVDIPALRKVTDNEAARRYWKEAFLRAAPYQAGLAGLTVVTSGIIYYMDESENRNMYLIGGGILATIFPWTKFVMMPEIKMLLDDNVLRQKGSDWVRTKIETWNKRHMFRSVVGLTVFGLFLYSL